MSVALALTRAGLFGDDSESTVPFECTSSIQ